MGLVLVHQEVVVAEQRLDITRQSKMGYRVHQTTESLGRSCTPQIGSSRGAL
jgi:hypothetical protein